MKSIAIVVAAVLLMVAGPTGAETAPGQMKGGVDYSLPSWFKSRFFHFRDDVEEARKQGRHVMVFLHLDQCPYCARILRENFIGGESRDFMQTRRVPANTAPTINTSPRCVRSNGASSKPMTWEMRLVMVRAPQRAGKVPTELTWLPRVLSTFSSVRGSRIGAT